MIYEIPTETVVLPEWMKENGGVPARWMKGGKLAEIPLMPVNMLVLGTSGYGKTEFTKAYVRGILNADEKKYAVFFQIKPDDFTGEFLRPQDKVITFSDKVFSGKNLFQWNLVREIRLCGRNDWETELEGMTSILFSDILQDSRNRIWADAAKSTFKAFARRILYCSSRNPSNRELIDAMKFMKRREFMKFLGEYPPNRSILRDNFEYDPCNCQNYTIPKKGSDIFFFLQNILEKFGGSFLSETGNDTVYDYLHGNYGERLFIVHDHKKRESSKLFERYFMRYIGDEILSLSSEFSQKKKMVWVLDEIDKIGYDFGLAQAVTLGRGYGLQILVSTQSLESLYAIAPELYGEHLTNASLSGFAMTAAFHPGDPFTIETLQKLYGECMKQRMSMPCSRYDHPTIKIEMRPVVENEEFASLDIGECYIKLRSEKPERVRILIG